MLVIYIENDVITINEHDKCLYAFIGITPLINSPLSNTKVSVLSCVLPGFGVLYKYYCSSIFGSDYSTYLEDRKSFLRKCMYSSYI